MTHYHALVWIDHQEARIFGIGPEESDLSKIDARSPHHHIHRKADHTGHGTESLDANFLRRVADALASARAIVVAGPGRAKTDLAGFLTEHFPAVAKNIWRIEAMDHPTDGELIAAARKYFHAEDRMHL